jgi:hypothetical protein
MRIFLAEKGLTVPTVQIDLHNGETVNAEEKLHRRAGVKLHYGRGGGWSVAANLSFPVRSVSLLSRPDLASPRARRAA